MYGQCPLGFLSIAQTHILEVYSGINEQFQVLDYVRKGKTFMTDRGFNITDPYHQGGLLHTRTNTKFNSQLIRSLLRMKLLGLTKYWLLIYRSLMLS